VADMQAGFVCADERCVVADGFCRSDGRCVVELSGWELGSLCNETADCAEFMAECIGAGGEGHCVAAPSGGECFSGSLGMAEPVEVLNVEMMLVEVCGYPTATCGADGLCFVACGSDGECTDANAPLCNLSTGRCECGDDRNCQDIDGGQIPGCAGTTCGCADDEACLSVVSRFDGGDHFCEFPGA